MDFIFTAEEVVPLTRCTELYPPADYDGGGIVIFDSYRNSNFPP